MSESPTQEEMVLECALSVTFGINIATFALRCVVGDGVAIALLGVDAPVDEATLATIVSLPQVKQAEALTFINTDAARDCAGRRYFFNNSA